MLCGAYTVSAAEAVEDIITSGMAVEIDADVSAYSVEYNAGGGLITFNEATGTITGCSDDATDVVIPPSINEIPVTGIEAGAFENKVFLTSVSIPGTVTSIGGWDDENASRSHGAFQGCVKLEKVTLGEGMTNIGYSMFRGCSMLKEIAIPSSVEVVHSRSFMDCPELKTVVFSDTTGNGASSCVIEHRAFNGDKIENLTLGKGIKRIDEYAFYGNDIKGTLVIPEGVTSIGNGAFENCTSITELTLPSTLTGVGGYDDSRSDRSHGMFQGCIKLEKVTLSEGMTNIGYSMFRGCSRLAEITLPSTMERLCSRSFIDCPELKTVVFSETYNNAASGCVIENNAFDGDNIENLTLGKGIKSIGDYAFYGNDMQGTLVIPEGATIGTCSFQGCASITELTISEGITSIGAGAFENCTSIKEVTLPSTLTGIGGYDDYRQDRSHGVFQGCIKLEKVTFNEGITNIGHAMFRDCSRLGEIIIPSSIEVIHTRAFIGCSELKTVVISDTTDNGANGCVIENNAFDGDNIESLTLGKGIKSIGDYAFYGNDMRGTLVIPEGAAIGTCSFQNCAYITELTISEGITSIGAGAFENCTSIKEVTLPSTLTGIGGYDDYRQDRSHGVFQGCIKLENVTFGEGMTFIGHAMFRDCSNLASAEIPGSVGEIGVRAFDNCDGLMTVHLGDSYDNKSAGCKIDNYAFSASEKLSIVKLERGVTSIGEKAFAGDDILEQVIMPETVKSISSNVIENSPLAAICAYDRDTYPIQFAIEKNLPYKILDANASLVYGDATGDGSLAAADAAMVLQKVLKSTYKMTIENLTEDYFKYVDVDADESLTSADAAMILQKVLKSSYQMPAEQQK